MDYLINVFLIKHYMILLAMVVTVLNVDSTQKDLIVKVANSVFIEMNMNNVFHVTVTRKAR